MDAGAFTGYTICGRLADDSSKVTGLVHDLGKLLYFFGSEYVLVLLEGDREVNTIHLRGQWDVVGVRDCNVSDTRAFFELRIGYFRRRLRVLR